MTNFFRDRFGLRRGWVDWPQLLFEFWDVWMGDTEEKGRGSGRVHDRAFSRVFFGSEWKKKSNFPWQTTKHLILNNSLLRRSLDRTNPLKTPPWQRGTTQLPSKDATNGAPGLTTRSNVREQRASLLVVGISPLLTCLPMRFHDLPLARMMTFNPAVGGLHLCLVV